MTTCVRESESESESESERRKKNSKNKLLKNLKKNKQSTNQTNQHSNVPQTVIVNCPTDNCFENSKLPSLMIPFASINKFSGESPLNKMLCV